MKTICIAGNVGRDAELKRIGNDSVLSFSVAVNSKVKGDDKTTWFDVSWWGKRAEAIAPYLKKGSRVVVTGDFDTNESNGKTYLKVRCNELTLMGNGKPREESSPSASTDDDINF